MTEIPKTIIQRAELQRKLGPARLFWFLHSTKGSWTIPKHEKGNNNTLQE